ncbi:MAG: ribokinase, partial [Solirubrobacterales bacterium]|nr:ribokinase [Solirubrobacterales bacterium]
MAPTSAPAVVVVGSLNMDIVVPVPRHPMPGETIIGADSLRTPGGKGANQAVAAARLGQQVAMVGRVGGDDAGRTLLAALGDYGVDYSRVAESTETPTGIALITVDPGGENIIVVSSGANARLGRADVEAAARVVASASAVLLQLEVPLEASIEAASRASGTVILNPAPAPSDRLPAELLEAVDVLVPNRSELADLAGVAARGSLEQLEALARSVE